MKVEQVKKKLANMQRVSGYTTSPFEVEKVRTGPTVDVLHDIADERERQVAKWGEQHHEDGTGPDVQHPLHTWAYTWSALSQVMRTRCVYAAKVSDANWEHILTEEYAEAMAESDPVKLREELVQLAAVCVAWCEDIDSRGGADVAAQAV